MNLLDLIVLGLLFSATTAGYRLGFFARVFSWIGMAAGIVVAGRLLPSVVRQFQDSEPQMRLLVALGFLLGTAMIGQGLGVAAGNLFHTRLSPTGIVRQGDRIGGAVTGALGVIVGVWLMTPALAHSPGWPARMTRDSTVIAAVNSIAPDPPDTLRALRSLMGDGGFPQVFGDLEASENVGLPPGSGLDPAVFDRVVDSTVKVSGEACENIQEGSGFVVAHELVATNAHVVAGDRSVRIEPFDGPSLQATVVAFDPDRDLALLRVPGLRRLALTIGESEVGQTGVVLGHPGGGPLHAAPAQIAREVSARGRDIYDRHATVRKVLILAAELRPGDSGGALVDTTGTVVGVAFAIAPDRPNVAYALNEEELQRVMAKAGTAPVPTGKCLAG